MIFIGVTELKYNSKNQWEHRKIHSHWNWKKGEFVKVIVFTNCQEVELYCNDKSLGSKFQSEFSKHELIWRTEFEAGILYAVGRIDGEVRASFELKTCSEAVKLNVTSDKIKLKPNKNDVAHLEVLITDDNGIPVYSANNRITCEIKGPIRLLGMEDANVRNTENYSDNEQNAYRGRLLVYIQSLDRTGKGVVTLSSEGMRSKEFVIHVVEN